MNAPDRAAMFSLAASSGRAFIVARRLGKTYAVGQEIVRALHEVSFEIRTGEFVAIMGPSGSGKSTLMNLIGALDFPTAGSLLIAGSDAGALSRDELADLRNRTIGFVFQHFNLLPNVTAVRQVMLPLVYARPRPTDPEAIAKMNLQQVGLDNHLHRYPRQLSGGQQQRVAIARALANEPKLLLADEPTGALDSSTSKEIMEVFRQLNGKGTTIVVVTHDEGIAKYAHRHIPLRDGTIVGYQPEMMARRVWLRGDGGLGEMCR